MEAVKAGTAVLPDTELSLDIGESEAVQDLEALWDSDDELFVDLNDNLVGAIEKEHTHGQQPQQPQAQALSQADSQTSRICHKCEKCGKTYVRPSFTSNMCRRVRKPGESKGSSIPAFEVPWYWQLSVQPLPS